MAAHDCVLIKLRNGTLTYKKDVKNEDCSQWFIENKGAKKVAPNELMKIKKLSRFLDELLKGKEIDAERGVRTRGMCRPKACCSAGL